MSRSYGVVMGDRGRVVIPAAVRAEAGFEEGAKLVLMPTASGLVLMTREQLRRRVQQDLAGLDLVDALLAERRLAAAADDQA